MLQDPVGKVSVGKWVRTEILYHKNATFGSERVQIAGYWKLGRSSFYAGHVLVVSPKSFPLVSAA